MMMVKLLRLSWKNIWRNPARSAVVITAVLLGTWAGVFLSAFFSGISQDYLKNQLDLSVGHIQIIHPRFEELRHPRFSLPQADRLTAMLRDTSIVSSITAQSLTGGLAQSTTSSYGVTIQGITEADNRFEIISKYLQRGSMFEGVTQNPVVISSLLAERLDLEPQSKMVLSFQDVNGEITAGAFRVSGIYDTFNDQHDRGNVFVLQPDLNRLLGKEDAVHKIIVKVTDFRLAPDFSNELSRVFPNLQVRNWKEISPALSYVFDMMDLTMYIVMIIIIIALVFSIINTMLMAVLERTRELGMLMAVGMNKTRIFGMIMAETFFLTMAGTPAGLLFSWATVSFFGTTGINLTAFSEGLNAYGLNTVIHPALSTGYYLNIAVMIALAAFLSALYPAWKTLQLKPVEAIRKIQ